MAASRLICSRTCRPSSSSGTTSLIATARFASTSLARYTPPMPPRPRRSWMRYRVLSLSPFLSTPLLSPSSLSKDKLGMAEAQDISVVQDLSRVQGLVIDARALFRAQINELVRAVHAPQLGVVLLDARIPEERDGVSLVP